MQVKKMFRLGASDEEVDWEAFFSMQAAKNSACDYAFEICVSRLARMISKCELCTYEKGKKVKGEAWYRLNVRPNTNQTAVEFWQEVITRLYHEGEVLIYTMPISNDLMIADSFTIDNPTAEVTHMVYRNITTGDFRLRMTLSASEVCHLRLKNKRVIDLARQITKEHTQLLSVAMKAYQNSVGMKAKLSIDKPPEQLDTATKKAMAEGLSKFFSDPDACFYEFRGYKFDPFDASRKGVQQSTRDIKALLDDALDLWCKAFLMPTNIATGEVTDTSKALTDFLTFCLDPDVRMLEQGLNNALYSAKEYLKGTRVRISTESIKHVDLLDMAVQADKLIGSGIASINDILRMAGMDEIPEPWADVHWMTKNYMSAIAALTEGGEANENEKPGVDDAGSARK